VKTCQLAIKWHKLQEWETHRAEGIADVLLTILRKIDWAGVGEHGDILGGGGNDVLEAVDSFL
jgi:hypothetical protein